jgi:hypothetical protein
VTSRVLAIALSIAFGSVGVLGSTLSSRSVQTTSSSPSSKRMPDGMQWMTENLNVSAEPSYCYDNAEENCRRYGRLYTWESAQRACRSLGNGWRLPTNEEWRDLAMHYGGLREDAHGFYWTASESGADHGWLYNFGKNGQSLNRHKDGEKLGAFSVRCVRE